MQVPSGIRPALLLAGLCMATKIKIMKMLQEIRGFSELGHKQPGPKPSTLFLMQVRTRKAEMHRTRQQIDIAFDLQDIATLPTPVKINFVGSPATNVG